MIDIHTHILPGIDDGADSLEISLEMLKLAKEKDMESIIATPHYHRGNFENSYEDVVRMAEDLTFKAFEEGIHIKVLPGQEVFLDKYTPKLYKEGILGGLNNSKYMLVETSMMNMAKDVLDIIYELRLLGVVPIIAHPERYRYIIEKPENINVFIKEGCLFQINTGSIKGLFGESSKKTSELLIKHGICSFVASDAHGIGRRCPGVLSNLDRVKEVNLRVYNSLEENCNSLLNDRIIRMECEEIKEKKSFFSFFKK